MKDKHLTAHDVKEIDATLREVMQEILKQNIPVGIQGTLINKLAQVGQKIMN